MIFFGNPPRAYVIALFVQAMLYGLYMLTFVHCTRWLVFDDNGWRFRPWTQVNLPMLTATVLVFVFETAELFSSVALVHEILNENHGLPVIAKKLIAVTMVLQLATLLIADAVMILRCWVIYAKSWRMICLPLFLWISMAGCLIPLTYWNTLPLSTTLESLTELPAVETVLICNLSNNLYVTFAIIYQIRHGSNGRSKHLYRIIAESGAIYSLTSMLLFVSVVIKQVRVYLGLICDAINFPVSGMAFNFILIRAARHRVQEATCPQTEGTISCSHPGGFS